MQSAAPRHFAPTAGLPGAGLPHDRAARLAARRSFVELKIAFLNAMETMPLPDAARLRQLVRSAEEPVDLWLLRAPLFEALAGPDPARRQQRHVLRMSLDSMFPDTGPASIFSPF